MTIEIEAGASQNQCSMKGFVSNHDFSSTVFLIHLWSTTPFPRLLKPLVVAIRVTAHRNLAR